VKGVAAKDALIKIRSTYNLLELSGRPMLLEMIVKSIDALNTDNINATTLYEIFTDAWIHRDKWRDVLSPEGKLQLLTTLANSLWTSEAKIIHYKELSSYLQDELSEQVQDPHQLIEIDSEIRTASFLTRDETGAYGFAHKSYMEFFVAKYLKYQLENDKPGKWLHTKRLTYEIVRFLNNMVDLDFVEKQLEEILCGEYKPYVSENALLCLYGLKREKVILTKTSEDKNNAHGLYIELPDNINLDTAQLDSINIEYAVLRNASLIKANMTESILSSIILTGSKLDGCNFEKANLVKAVLTNVRANTSIFRSANCENTDFTNSDLSSANLSDGFFINATFAGAKTEYCIIEGSVFSENVLYNVFGVNSELADKNKSYWTKVNSLRGAILKQCELICRKLGGSIDPEDLASEVLIEIVMPHNLDKLDTIDNKTLFGIAHRVANKMSFSYQSEKEITFSQLSIEDFDFPKWLESIESSQDSPFQNVANYELRDKLSAGARFVFEQYFVYGLTIDEISKSMNISKYKIKSLLNKINEILREHIAPTEF
jgi:RNA polymerase sigma factor (sigma-70 family)